MPTTTPDGLPFPAQSDPPNGPAQLQALAEQVQAVIAGHRAAADPHPVYLTQTEGDARYATPASTAKAVQAPLAGAGMTWGEAVETIANPIAVGSASAAFPQTFPAGTFDNPPMVVATVSTIVGGTGGLVAKVANVTKAGFDLVFYNLGAAQVAGSTTVRAMWHAVGY